MARSLGTSTDRHWIFDIPLFLLAFGMVSISMLVPAFHGLVSENFVVARAFLYSGILGAIAFGMIAIVHMGNPPRHGTLGPLMSLFSVMVVLPIFLAIPFHEGLRTTSFLNAYVEMVSSVTTTGASVFDDPNRLSNTLHLWRAQVGWMGGFVMWVSAAAILAPLNLGGFEITAQAEPGRQHFAANRMRRANVRERLFRTIKVLFPIYVGLTGVLWVLLIITGDPALIALCHAMSTLATSGISPLGGLDGSGAGFSGEVLIFLFLIFAISRLTFSTDTVTSKGQGLHTDPEFQLALFIIISIPVLLFARHWLGTLDVSQNNSVMEGMRAFWGSLFTVLSFLTTTGFTSADWSTAQGWSGLNTPGVILMGLALIGGGIATTAGGVKLLRVYALYRQGVREMEKLVHPSSVSGVRGLGRRLQIKGAFIAWIFFMLFALTLAVVSLALAALGVGFEDAMILAVASLSNTGPLILTAGTDPISLANLSIGAKSVFCAAMIVGRLETLAIIALITPDLWRA